MQKAIHVLLLEEHARFYRSWEQVVSLKRSRWLGESILFRALRRRLGWDNRFTVSAPRQERAHGHCPR